MDSEELAILMQEYEKKNGKVVTEDIIIRDDVHKPRYHPSYLFVRRCAILDTIKENLTLSANEITARSGISNACVHKIAKQMDHSFPKTLGPIAHKIVAYITANPNASDNIVAKECDASSNYVYSVRRKLLKKEA